VVAQVSAPQDAEIAKLNNELNKTYVFYGKRGRVAKERQVLQDAEAGKLAPAVLSQRAASKSSALYNNAMWDLVDAIEQKKVKLKDVKEEDLPAELKDMSLDERQAYVAKKAAQRKAIQKKIQELAQARKAYVAEQRKKEAGAEKPGAPTLEKAIVDAVRDQAAKKDFKFDPE